jgi:hypothetical protein
VESHEIGLEKVIIEAYCSGCKVLVRYRIGGGHCPIVTSLPIAFTVKVSARNIDNKSATIIKMLHRLLWHWHMPSIIVYES